MDEKVWILMNDLADRPEWEIERNKDKLMVIVLSKLRLTYAYMLAQRRNFGTVQTKLNVRNLLEIQVT